MFSALAIILYAVAWSLILKNALNKEPKSSLAMMIILAGIIAHFFSVYFSLHSEAGMQLGVFKVSSLFMLVINMIVGLSSLKKPLHNLFLGLLPLSVLSILIGLIFSSPITAKEHISSGTVVHILLSILAYSLLTIASLQAILLAYQNKMLRTKHPSNVMGFLPPLQTMETLMFELVWGGMVFLTLSILVGFVIIEDFLGQKLRHKTTFTVISWLIYATLLGGRHFLGWRGISAIRWVLGGFIALMLAYFGSKFVIEVILGGK